MDITTRVLSMGAAGTSTTGRWIATFSSGAWKGVSVDSAGNAYVVGDLGLNCVLAKISPSGSVLWSRTLTGASTDYFNSVSVSSSDAIFAAGVTDSQGAGGNELLVASYDVDGAIQWQRSLGGVNSEIGYSVFGDNFAYVAGSTTSQGAGSEDALIARYSNSGVIDWQRSLGGTGGDYAQAITTGETNVYACGKTGTLNGNLFVAKYSTGGALTWQRSLTGSAVDTGNAIVTDTSENSYIVGNTSSQGAGGFDILLVKYNVSGVIQWQRSLGGAGTEDGNGIAMESGASNFYIVGDTSGTGTGDLVIACYNTSGAIQWQRTLGRASTGDTAYGIAIGPGNTIYVLADTFLARLPADGSSTGTYSTYVYASSSLTDSARTLTDAAAGLTSSTTTLTDSARTLTDAAGSVSTTVTTV
jgi:hypothetical protein